MRDTNAILTFHELMSGIKSLIDCNETGNAENADNTW